MRLLRYFLFVVAGTIAVTLTLAAVYYYKGFHTASHHSRRAHGSLPAEESSRLYRMASAQRSFLKAQGYNPDLCFLVDMKLASGKNRFFVYDLRHDSVLDAGLVAHGSAGKNFCISAVFSNVNGSNCTALGKYRIGKPYNGRFGRAYKLYGLDSSNDQAYNRNIVLHSFRYVPPEETDPYPICNSQGCPMVAPQFLERLTPLIDQSARPVLLCIFH